MAAMLVEIVVPRTLVSDLQDFERDDSKFEPADDSGMRFGIVEIAAILAVVNGVAELIEHGVKIWKLLRSSGNEELSSTIRSPVSDAEVTIKPDDSEEDLRKRIKDAFTEA